MPTAPEPPRQAALSSLTPAFRVKVQAVLNDLRGHGADPIVFEARRTQERQDWLYGYGRTHHVGKKPSTWTHNSRHLKGTAADIVDRKTMWSDPEFFDLLKRSAIAHGLHDWAHGQTWSGEHCHVEL